MQTVDRMTKRRWKLRRLLRKHPDLLDRLMRLRSEGLSYAEMSVELAKSTDEYIDPTVIRDWLTEINAKQEM